MEIAQIRKRLKQTGERNLIVCTFSITERALSKAMKINMTAICPKSTPKVKPISSATKEGDSEFRLETPAKPKPCMRPKMKTVTKRKENAKAFLERMAKRKNGDKGTSQQYVDKDPKDLPMIKGGK